MSSTTAITHISDTARVVAHCRALESARPDAWFQDTFAERLAGPPGAYFARQLGDAELIARSIAVRTVVFDEIILDCIASREVDFVVSLAAGLDARPWRLPLPRSLCWVDVDLPELLRYKGDMLRAERPLCHYRSVAADLADKSARRELIAACGDLGRRGLVLTEGLLVYLSPTEVAVIARELADTASIHYWLSDLVGPPALDHLRTVWQPIVAGSDIRFQFAPSDGPSFFEPLGWREARYVSSVEEAGRRGRSPLSRWARMLLWLGTAARREAVRRLSGTALLQRLEAS